MNITIYYKNPKGQYTWYFDYKEDLKDFIDTVWNMKEVYLIKKIEIKETFKPL